jgi:hypothetical protein
LFFVDLEPAENNKEIYNIKELQNKIIQTEPPRVNKNNIIQCMKCQNMATQIHTVTNHSCVLNVVDLITAKNAKSKETPAKCALCGGNHPANYKSWEHYHNLIKGKNTFRNNTQCTPPIHTNIYRNNI